ncbi:Ty3/gypsy retrotransposon protein [Cucumis melo var. makuwa]|uniref:Ty3/gypsy retrotransposon protein n=1 Tax=Cucumis melo var. makuwa TaxID=1194695 RepID=A0A5A7T7P1_CUCMM|nr:Ty3/gypsy retrotransposon protein [Cucumis melo var. makuwa]TYK03105.1 Ty3/gypsy retrotransposon protein [Cucumis melo var. makuwa]
METPNSTLDQQLKERDVVLGVLKEHLKLAQERMKKQADMKRREVEFHEGYFVFLKIRPYRQVTLRKKRNEKLSPNTTAVHPVFHVSQLKKAVGNGEIAQAIDPYVNENHEWITQPEEVYSYRKNPATKEWEALVSWKGLPPHEATWENCADMKYQFLEFHLEDKVDLKEESDARSPILFTYNRRNKKIHEANEGGTLGSKENSHEANEERACGGIEESKEIGDQQGGPQLVSTGELNRAEKSRRDTDIFGERRERLQAPLQRREQSPAILELCCYLCD